MHDRSFHISEEDLIRSADRELPEWRLAEIEAHLATCEPCRGRSNDIEKTIANFANAYRETLDCQIPSPFIPRALFRSRLRELASEYPVTFWSRFNFFKHRMAYLFATFLFVLTALSLWQSARPSLALSPNPKLTPGLALPLTEADICRERSGTRPRLVLASIGKKVFDEYGIRNPEPRHYEMDYLIDPDLGGSDDSSNLWPQPYSAMWNAHVKDALEENLRDLVCAGKISLAQAQRDIATDWIATYKNYFHTDRPLPSHLAFQKDEPWE